MRFLFKIYFPNYFFTLSFPKLPSKLLFLWFIAFWSKKKKNNWKAWFLRPIDHRMEKFTRKLRWFFIRLQKKYQSLFKTLCSLSLCVLIIIQQFSFVCIVVQSLQKNLDFIFIKFFVYFQYNIFVVVVVVSLFLRFTKK